MFSKGKLTAIWLLISLILSSLQLLIYLYYAKDQKLISGRFSFLGWKSVKFSLLGILFITLGNKILMSILDWFGLGIETTANQASILEMVGSYPAILLFAQSVLLAPIIEEIIYRGILGDLLCDRKWYAYPVTAIIFSLVHSPTDFASFLVYLWPGLVFYWIRQKTDYLESAMVTHMLMNGLAFLAAYLAHYGHLTP